MKSIKQLETVEERTYMRHLAMIARQYVHPSRFHGIPGEFTRCMNRAAVYLGLAISSRNRANRLAA